MTTTTEENINQSSEAMQVETGFAVSFGKGRKGAPSDPEFFSDIEAFAEAIADSASLKRFADDVSLTDYKKGKNNNRWVMRAIDPATAFDSENNRWHRRNGSVMDVNWLVFDADKMPEGSYDAVYTFLKSEGYAFLMYRTPGDKLTCKGGCEAFRVFLQCLPVAGPIAQAVSRDMRLEWLPKFEGGEWDPIGDRPTCIMYLPVKGEVVEWRTGALVDCAAWFADFELTLVEKSATGLEREELHAAVESFGAYQYFIEWCLVNIDDAVILKKPDGRIALQMPGQQPEKYSGGEDDGDGWNFYSPSGGFDMLVFRSLHKLTEPEETFKTADAVNVLVACYGSEPARLYAAASKEAQVAVKAAEVAFSRPSLDLSALCGKPPAGSTLTPTDFFIPLALDWPEDKRGDAPEVPPPPAEGEDSAKYDAAVKALDAWIAAGEKLRIERHQHYNDRFVLVADGSLVADLTKSPHAPLLSYEDFKRAHSNNRYSFKGSNGQLVFKSYAEAWLTSEQRHTVDMVGYAPGEERIYFDEAEGCLKLNTFYIAPFEYTEAEDLLWSFFAIVDNTHQIDKEADKLLQWLAFTFRYPGERIQYAWANVNETQGSGRDSLRLAMARVLGDHNVTGVGADTLVKNDYHDWAVNSLLTYVGEADKGNGKRIPVKGTLKEMITDKGIRQLNPKSKPQIRGRIFCSMFFALNSYSLLLEEDDRRIEATTGTGKGAPKLPRATSDHFYSVLNTAAFRDQLASFLWRADLTDFDFTFADTTNPARARLLANSTSEVDHLVEELIAELPGKVVPIRWMKNQVKVAVKDTDLRHTAVMARLREFCTTAEPKDTAGKSVRSYVFGDVDNVSKELQRVQSLSWMHQA